MVAGEGEEVQAHQHHHLVEQVVLQERMELWAELAVLELLEAGEQKEEQEVQEQLWNQGTNTDVRHFGKTMKNAHRGHSQG